MNHLQVATTKCRGDIRFRSGGFCGDSVHGSLLPCYLTGSDERIAEVYAPLQDIEFNYSLNFNHTKILVLNYAKVL